MGFGNSAVKILGERLCLDFVNTANWSPDHQVADEKLEDLQDLALWAQEVGILPRDAGAADSRLARVDLEAMKVFRGHLRALLLSTRSHRPVPEDSLAALNRVLGDKAPGLALRARGTELDFAANVGLHQKIALSAVALLTTPRDLGRLKLCPGDRCAWLFLDESRNGRRRWCAMETCGNRAKARRHYARYGLKAQ